MKILQKSQQCFAYLKYSGMVGPMRLAPRLLAISFLVPFFTQCGSKSAPSTNAVTGPFDNRGNYIEDWVDQPDKWFKPTSQPEGKSKQTSTAKKETTPPPDIAVVTQSQPRPEIKSTPRPTPKPTPKPKPKPKPTVITHKVKKGDTLSGLSRKYGTSISKIQSANGIRGSVIRLGQTLKIPK